MFTHTAEFYDALYSFKDYCAESARLRDLIARERPGAKTILDIACGTAEHARHLSGDFRVDGIDLEPRFIDIARKKNPSGHYEVADMRRFDLGRRYDVVQC